MCTPALEDPGRVIPSIRGLTISASPTTDPGPVTKLNTPSGRPASRKHWARSAPAHGVSVAGLKTTGLPAARAAPAGPPERAMGKLKGETTTHTPWGRRTLTFVAR